MIFDIPIYNVYEVVKEEIEYMGWVISESDYSKNVIDRMCTKIALKYSHKTFLRIQLFSCIHFCNLHNCNREGVVFRMTRGLILTWNFLSDFEKIEHNMKLLKDRKGPFPLLIRNSISSTPLQQSSSVVNSLNKNFGNKTLHNFVSCIAVNNNDISDKKFLEINRGMDKRFTRMSLNGPYFRENDQLRETSKETVSLKSTGVQTDLSSETCECHRNRSMVSVETQTVGKIRKQPRRKFSSLQVGNKNIKGISNINLTQRKRNKKD